jgi:hypothetical protein
MDKAAETGEYSMLKNKHVDGPWMPICFTSKLETKELAR